MWTIRIIDQLFTRPHNKTTDSRRVWNRTKVTERDIVLSTFDIERMTLYSAMKMKQLSRSHQLK